MIDEGDVVCLIDCVIGVSREPSSSSSSTRPQALERVGTSAIAPASRPESPRKATAKPFISTAS